MTDKHIWKNGETITADLLNGMSDYADEKVDAIPKIDPDTLVKTANGQAPDKTGNVDLSYMARQDKVNNFAQLQVFTGGIGNIVIAANTDMNTIGVSGWYRCTDTPTVATLVNAPAKFTKGFIMEVIGQGTQFSTQIAWSIDWQSSGTHMAIRSGNSGSQIYGVWQYVATNADITELDNKVKALQAQISGGGSEPA